MTALSNEKALREALERIATAASATWCNTEWIAQHARKVLAETAETSDKENNDGQSST